MARSVLKILRESLKIFLSSVGVLILVSIILTAVDFQVRMLARCWTSLKANGPIAIVKDFWQTLRGYTVLKDGEITTNDIVVTAFLISYILRIIMICASRKIKSRWMSLNFILTMQWASAIFLGLVILSTELIGIEGFRQMRDFLSGKVE